MLRILSALAALAMASTTVFVASSHITSPATSSSATTATVTTSAKTTATQGVTADIPLNVMPSTTASTITTASVATTGNGAPSGAHYNLNIIGVPKDKTASMTTGDGHRIFVQLWGGEDAVSLNGKLSNQLLKVNKIFLQPAPAGESFQVLDANATDANGALFQLPADVSATWTVWGRALGTPGGKANMTTCATTAGLDGILGTADDEVICSMGTLSLDRTKGNHRRSHDQREPRDLPRCHLDLDGDRFPVQRLSAELLLELRQPGPEAPAAPVLSGSLMEPSL